MIPADKVNHIYWGATMGYAALWSVWAAVLLIVLAAACKEAWDHAHPPNHADTWDFLATVIGGAVAIGVVLLHRVYP